MIFMIFLLFSLHFGKHNVQVIQTTAYFNFMFSQYWAKMSDYWCVGLSNRWSIATHPTILLTKLHRKYIVSYCIVFFSFPLAYQTLNPPVVFVLYARILIDFMAVWADQRCTKEMTKESNMMRRNEREPHTPREREPFDPPRACLKTAKLCLL